VAAQRTQRVIPDGYADLLVYDTGQVEVTGLHDRVDLPVLPAGTRIRGIRFRPEAVAAAFRTTGASLRNLTIPADDVFGTARAARLHDHRELDRWLRSLDPDPRTTAAVRLLAAHSVVETADQLGITDRQLRRVMVDITGLAPKAYQRVLRLQRFIAVARHATGLAAAAAEAGYSDQAHLTRDARTLTGLTPARLLQHQG
jgi:AraC-like DNA-binding protein